jgi:hypothetical protein
MFSSSDVGADRRFHGQRAATSSGRPSAVKYRSSGHRPVPRRISSMAARGSFSTGLPSRQPAARPVQAP